MSQRSQFEVTLARSVTDTWRLVIDPDALGTWMIGTFEFEPEPGSALRFTNDGRRKEGIVLEVIEHQLLVWRWNDGSEESVVSIEIEGDESSSMVRICETLLPPRRWSQPSIPPIEASVA